MTKPEEVLGDPEVIGNVVVEPTRILLTIDGAKEVNMFLSRVFADDPSIKVFRLNGVCEISRGEGSQERYPSLRFEKKGGYFHFTYGVNGKRKEFTISAAFVVSVEGMVSKIKWNNPEPKKDKEVVPPITPQAHRKFLESLGRVED